MLLGDGHKRCKSVYVMATVETDRATKYNTMIIQINSFSGNRRVDDVKLTRA